MGILDSRMTISRACRVYLYGTRGIAARVEWVAVPATQVPEWFNVVLGPRRVKIPLGVSLLKHIAIGREGDRTPAMRPKTVAVTSWVVELIVITSPLRGHHVYR